MKELEGKTAVVTGANRGIGNGVVREFAASGCNIWACARKQTAEFEAEMSALALENNVNIRPLYFELSSEEETKEAFKVIYKEKQPVDILVNAAGIVNTDLFQMTTMETMRKVFDVNFFGTVYLTQLMLKIMQRYKKGSIINISSISGLDIRPTNCTYGSSKAALIHFSKLLASEVGKFGIRVNSIAPGPTKTDMIKDVERVVGDSMLERCALERCAEINEIADVCVFLGSDKSSFVNGHVIRVDGGCK